MSKETHGPIIVTYKQVEMRCSSNEVVLTEWEDSLSTGQYSKTWCRIKQKITFHFAQMNEISTVLHAILIYKQFLNYMLYFPITMDTINFETTDGIQTCWLRSKNSWICEYLRLVLNHGSDKNGPFGILENVLIHSNTWRIYV